MIVNGHLHFYVGTYTDSPSQSQGIACVSLDTATGALTLINELVPDAVKRFVTLLTLRSKERVYIPLMKSIAWQVQS